MNIIPKHAILYILGSVLWFSYAMAGNSWTDFPGIQFATSPANPVIISVDGFDNRGALVTHPDGNLQLVIRSNSNSTVPSSLLHLWYNSTTSQWLTDANFGSNCIGIPSMCVNVMNNNLEVLVRDASTHKLLHLYRDQIPSGWHAETNWEFGTNVTGNPAFICNAYPNHRGNLDAFFKDGTGIRHFYRVPTDPSIWYDEGIIPLTAQTGIASDPGVGQSLSGTYDIHLVAQGTDGYVYDFIRNSSTLVWTKIQIPLNINNATISSTIVYNRTRNTMNILFGKPSTFYLYEYAPQGALYQKAGFHFNDEVNIPNQAGGFDPTLAIGYSNNDGQLISVVTYRKTSNYPPEPPGAAQVYQMYKYTY